MIQKEMSSSRITPICSKCSSNESEMWRKTDDGVIQCNRCANNINNNDCNEKNQNESQPNDIKTNPVVKPPLIGIRKSVRCKGRIRTSFLNKPNTVKGKSRRIVFKRNTLRAPTAFASAVTSNYIFFKGCYYQIGDIVSMVDIDGDTYYAQIRGFLTDQYCEKSAVITWLLPSQHSPTDHFDASTYYLGPEEDIPRKLECMKFVCHSPSDYFKSRFSPFPTLNMKQESGFIWTRIGPQIVKTSMKDELSLQSLFN